MTKIVPYTRLFGRGAQGQDVKAVKRALRRSKALKRPKKGQPTPVFGLLAVAALKRFQKQAGIPVTGTYTLATHKKLAKHFDDYGAHLMIRVAAKKKVEKDLVISQKRKEKKARAEIVADAYYFLSIRDRVRYTQSSRRMDIIRNKKRPPVAGEIWEDCSSWSTALYWLAGVKDPNGLSFNLFGFTGTQVKHGKKVSVGEASPGDLVFYGRAWPYKHVAVYVGNGKVIGHGSDSGPHYLPINYRSDLALVCDYITGQL